MTEPDDRRLDEWIAEVVRLARDAARLGQTGTAGALDALGNFLADLRDQRSRGSEAEADLRLPPLRKIELSRDWIFWISSEAYTVGASPGTPRLAEASPAVRDFMIRRAVATIKALGEAHKAISANPHAQPPIAKRKEGTLP